MVQQGSRLLQVTSIIMLVFSAIAGIALLIGTLGSLALMTVSVGLGAVALVAVVVGLLSSALNIVASILGIINWKRPEKAQAVFVFGVILVVLAAISFISNITSDGGNVFTALVGLVLPVLYMVGAMQLKKMA